MSQLNLKRLAFKMFVVVQVTLVVDSPRLENEVMLNHRNN